MGSGVVAVALCARESVLEGVPVVTAVRRRVAVVADGSARADTARTGGAAMAVAH